MESKTAKPKALAVNAAKVSKPGKSKFDTKDVKYYSCGKKGLFKNEYRKPIKKEIKKMNQRMMSKNIHLLHDTHIPCK
jgi:hypothetical protein